MFAARGLAGSGLGGFLGLSPCLRNSSLYKDLMEARDTGTGSGNGCGVAVDAILSSRGGRSASATACCNPHSHIGSKPGPQSPKHSAGGTQHR